jgi:Flp pilus assembly protein TadG
MSRFGQISIEFTLLVTILLIILLGTIYFNSSYWLQLTSAKIDNDAQAISDMAAIELNLAVRAGSGYSRMFHLPTKVSESYDYNLTVTPYVLYLNWTEGNAPAESVLLVYNITGNLKTGENMIRNENGIIYVN